MEKNDQQNFVLAIGLTLGIMLLAQIFLWGPSDEARRAEIERQQAILAETAPAEEVEALPRDREEVLAETFSAPATSDADVTDAATAGPAGRINFDAPAIDGSIYLRGARIDDLSLKRHFVTVKREEEQPVFSPVGARDAWYAVHGWAGDERTNLPDENSVWSTNSTQTLTPDTPLTLRYDNGELAFLRTISVDENYMFTITDEVTNNSNRPAVIRPVAAVKQHGLPEGWKPFYILHEGAIGVFGAKLNQKSYKDLDKGKQYKFDATGGWIGLTTKYWMAALIPDQTEPYAADARLVQSGNGIQGVYTARTEGTNRSIGAGETITHTSRLFAGAKRVEILEDYQKIPATAPNGDTLAAIPRFTDAVDWGNFWFFTKPFFWILNLFNNWLNSFGLAILALTVIVKLAFFPMQSKAYESMAKMRKLMPEMEKIKERFAADKQRQQKEILALYQREKANPFAGCLPLIPQMFVFYALYKTLFVTLEMRHEPFFGWINDLSAPDPTSLFNLFGLIPWDPSTVPLLGPVLAVGVWPLLYGVTMWALQSLSPPPPDPTQRMMMQYLPVIFTIIFAGFAAGLVIYWTWSNVLSIAQQWYIMRKNGVETPVDRWLAKTFHSSSDDS